MAGQRSDNDSPLLRLPQELFDLIVTFLLEEPVALLDLRATCTAFKDSLEDLVLTRFFSQRTFLLANKPSMETALLISQHSVFCKSLQRVQFSFATLGKASGQVNEEMNCKHRSELEKLESETSAEGPVGHIQQRKDIVRKRHHHQQVHKEILKEERKFRHNASDARLLHQVLSQLKAIGNIPALIAGGPDFASERYQRQAWGYNRMSRQLGWPTVPCLNVDLEDCTLFHILFQVVRETEYPVVELELGYAAFGVPLSMFEPFPGNLAFANLRTLSLAIEPTTQEIQNIETNRFERTESLLSCFADFLCECRNLETLALTRTHFNLARNVSGRIFEAVVSVVTKYDHDKIQMLSRLSSFSLQSFAFDWPDLVRFVEATRASLVSLAVYNELATVPNVATAVRLLRKAHGGGNLVLRGPMFEESESDSEALFR